MLRVHRRSFCGDLAQAFRGLNGPGAPWGFIVFRFTAPSKVGECKMVDISTQQWADLSKTPISSAVFSSPVPVKTYVGLRPA